MGRDESIILWMLSTRVRMAWIPHMLISGSSASTLFSRLSSLYCEHLLGHCQFQTYIPKYLKGRIFFPIQKFRRERKRAREWKRERGKHSREGLLPNFDVTLPCSSHCQAVKEEGASHLGAMIRAWIIEEGLWRKSAGTTRKVTERLHASCTALNWRLSEHTFILFSLWFLTFQKIIIFHFTMFVGKVSQKCYKRNE